MDQSRTIVYGKQLSFLLYAFKCLKCCISNKAKATAPCIEEETYNLDVVTNVSYGIASSSCGS